MPRKAYAVVEFPDQQLVAASVSTTRSMIVLTLGDGREEHYTYPADGQFHITSHNTPSIHSFFAPGPSFDDLSYHRLSLITVPADANELARPYTASIPPLMTIPAPTERDGVLEVGILGRKSSPELVASLKVGGT